ncbi:MAG: tetratricopeptide repeat protein, partial [Candidatus Odinarchaeota archaeon]
KIFKRMEDYPKALKHFENSLKIYRKNPDKADSLDKAKTMNEIGSIYYKLQEYKKAQEYFIESLSILEKFGDPSTEAEALITRGLIYSYKNDFHAANRCFTQGLDILLEITKPFDFINFLEEIFVANHELAYKLSLKSPYGLLWLFGKHNEYLDSNRYINGELWFALVKATETWWAGVFKEIKSEFGGRFTAFSTIESSEKDDQQPGEKKVISLYKSDWLLNQRLMMTQKHLTTETLVNMLVGVNDLDTDRANDYKKLRDLQADLAPYWFCEFPLKVEHGEKYLKIRLNNRVRRGEELLGYPQIDKDHSPSIKGITLELETQWQQKAVIDHFFVPKNETEYNNYELNPFNTLLSDIYTVELGDRSKQEDQIELTYKIEFYCEAETGNETLQETVKTTSHRLIIPIHRKNYLQRIEKYRLNHDNALAVLLAVFSMITTIFYNILYAPEFVILNIGLYTLLFSIIGGSLIFAGRGKSGAEERRDMVGLWKQKFETEPSKGIAEKVNEFFDNL